MLATRRFALRFAQLISGEVEEGRHLWAMVYLLHAYFGRDGREEARELLSAIPVTPTSHAFWHLQRAHPRLDQLLHVHLLQPIATVSSS